MPEDKRIDKTLIEVYIKLRKKIYLIIVWALGSENVVSDIWPTGQEYG